MSPPGAVPDVLGERPALAQRRPGRPRARRGAARPDSGGGGTSGPDGGCRPRPGARPGCVGPGGFRCPRAVGVGPAWVLVPVAPTRGFVVGGCGRRPCPGARPGCAGPGFRCRGLWASALPGRSSRLRRPRRASVAGGLWASAPPGRSSRLRRPGVSLSGAVGVGPDAPSSGRLRRPGRPLPWAVGPACMPFPRVMPRPAGPPPSRRCSLLRPAGDRPARPSPAPGRRTWRR